MPFRLAVVTFPRLHKGIKLEQKQTHGQSGRQNAVILIYRVVAARSVKTQHRVSECALTFALPPESIYKFRLATVTSLPSHCSCCRMQRWRVLVVSRPCAKLAQPAVNPALELSFDAVRADRGPAHCFAVSLACSSPATPSTSFGGNTIAALCGNPLPPRDSTKRLTRVVARPMVFVMRIPPHRLFRPPFRRSTLATRL